MTDVAQQPRPPDKHPPSEALSNPTSDSSNAATQNTSSRQQARHRSDGARGGRRTNGRGGRRPENTNSNLAVNAVAFEPQNRNTNSRRGRGRGRGGSQLRSLLTEEAPSSQSDTSQPRNRRDNRPRRGGRQQAVSSTAGPSNHEDVRTAITEELRSSSYECMICFDVVKPWNPVWSCGKCWAVFHLKCVKKWSKKSMDELTQAQRESEGTHWRCPGCQNKKSDVPSEYRCFCQKVQDPQVNHFITPHSCGETCNLLRPTGCPHPCAVPCHPGPHPACTAMGPVTQCHCGKESYQVRCSETDYSSLEGTRSCGQACGKLLDCKKHACNNACHSGPCSPCLVQESRRCYCGQQRKDLLCGQGIAKVSTVHKTEGEEEWNDSWEGYYDCEQLCTRPFACGIHACERRCHPQDAMPSMCPRDPRKVTRCPCGHTKIMPGQRTKCTDPIPTCQHECGKVRTCGHRDTAKCHLDECGPCTEVIKVTCRCGSSSMEMQCFERAERLRRSRDSLALGEDGGIETSDDTFLCNRICHTLRSCRKHECGIRCCPMMLLGQQKKGKRRGQPLAEALSAGFTEDQVDIFHLCKLTCGKPLGCKVPDHHCQALCHSGSCGPCMNASFDELTCACGRTVMYPPIPCGTRPPPCRFPCQKQRECGHPMPDHLCHPNDEPCPPCAYLTEKTCTCGKERVKNVPCRREHVSCGKVCGQLLACGGHLCTSICHEPGQCPPCTQVCLKPRSLCRHPCLELCHAPFPCPEDQSHPCQAHVKVSCACGTLHQTVVCMTTTANANQESHGPRIVLPCTTACEIANRNARLAEALNVDPNHREKGEGLGAHEWDPELMDLYAQFPAAWVKSMEVILDEVTTKAQKTNLKKSHLFPPMKPNYRDFLKRLAEEYGMLAEMVDHEPQRAVFVSTRGALTQVPVPSLSNAITLRPKLEAHAAAIAAAEQAEAEALAASKLSKISRQPVNAISLSSVTVGLTQVDIEQHLDSVLATLQTPAMEPSRFTVRWHGDEDASIAPEFKATQTADDVEHYVRDVLKSKLRATKVALTSENASPNDLVSLASGIEACWINKDGKITYRESQDSHGDDDEASAKSMGWAAMVAAPKPKPLATANAFSALSPGWTSVGPRKKIVLGQKQKKEAPPPVVARAVEDVPDEWDQGLDTPVETASTETSTLKDEEVTPTTNNTDVPEDNDTVEDSSVDTGDKGA